MTVFITWFFKCFTDFSRFVRVFFSHSAHLPQGHPSPPPPPPPTKNTFSSDLAWIMRECLTGVGLLCMDTLSCIHGVGRWPWEENMIHTVRWRSSSLRGAKYLLIWSQALSVPTRCECFGRNALNSIRTGAWVWASGVNQALLLFSWMSFIGP